MDKETLLTALTTIGIFVGVFGALTIINPVAILGALTAIFGAVLTILLRIKDHGLEVPTSEAAE